MVRPAQVIVAIALITVAGGRPTQAQERGSPSNPSDARIVNVTTDSSPGWSPSAAQSQAAKESALAYLAARDKGGTEIAYDMLEDGNKSLQPFAPFSRGLTSFNKQAGEVIERRIVNVTWTKDPAQAPKPGIYAAIDLKSRFANIDRHCGYMVVYQLPTGGPFRVVREESNFLTNADVTAIERRQSKAAAEAAWAQLAARCPNYPGEDSSSSAEPLPEQEGSIGYTTVAEALRDLRARPGVAFTSEGGWTIATDDAGKTIWVFSSEGKPAYPAAIKRQFVNDKQGGMSLVMSVLCEASKRDCDDLVRTFQDLNDRMTAELGHAR